jgi:hypothetical protein
MKLTKTIKDLLETGRHGGRSPLNIEPLTLMLEKVPLDVAQLKQVGYEYNLKTGQTDFGIGSDDAEFLKLYGIPGCKSEVPVSITNGIWWDFEKDCNPLAPDAKFCQKLTDKDFLSPEDFEEINRVSQSIFKGDPGYTLRYYTRDFSARCAIPLLGKVQLLDALEALGFDVYDNPDQYMLLEELSPYVTAIQVGFKDGKVFLEQFQLVILWDEDVLDILKKYGEWNEDMQLKADTLPLTSSAWIETKFNDEGLVSVKAYSWVQTRLAEEAEMSGVPYHKLMQQKIMKGIGK